MLLVSPKIHPDGTNLPCKSKGNVFYRKEDEEGHSFSAARKPGSLQPAFHSVLILATAWGTQDQSTRVLGSRHTLPTPGVFVNNKPWDPPPNARTKSLSITCWYPGSSCPVPQSHQGLACAECSASVY